MKNTITYMVCMGCIASLAALGGDKNQTLVVPKSYTTPTIIKGTPTLPAQSKYTLPYQVRGTRTDMGALRMTNVVIQVPGQVYNPNRQPPSASMSLPNKEADAKLQKQYQACKDYVKAVKGGAYDGRWSGNAPGQIEGFGKMSEANKIGEQCPPELLGTRTVTEWEK